MLTESLTGFAKAHRDIVLLDQEFRFVRRKRAKTGGKVALISGGGSGHEPLHIGFVGSRGLKVIRGLVGNHVTSLEMAGCSVTLTLLDEQTTALWDAPVYTAALRS